MAVTTRRAVLAGAALGIGATVAAATMLRKPPPQVHKLVDEPAAALLGMDALVRADPPQAPAAFDFTDAAGARHTLADFAGRGVVVNLWATWCVPCVAELPSLAALAGKVAAAGILVLPLSSDRGGAALVRTFYQGHGIAGLDVWLDPGGAAARALGARGVPTTLIVDRQGRVRARLEGGADWGSESAATAVRALAA